MYLGRLAPSKMFNSLSEQRFANSSQALGPKSGPEPGHYVCIIITLFFLFGDLLTCVFRSHAHKGTVMDLKFNRNGNWFLTASRDHLIKLYDIRQLKEERQVRIFFVRFCFPENVISDFSHIF